MNWCRIILIALSAFVAIGGLCLKSRNKPKILFLLIVVVLSIATILAIVLEIKDKRIPELEKKQEKLEKGLEDIQSKAESLKFLLRITIESGNFKNLGVDGLDYKFSIDLKYTIESEIPARTYNVKRVDCVIYDGSDKVVSSEIDGNYAFKYQRGERTRTLTGGSRIQIIDPKAQLVLYVDNEIIESDIFDLSSE